MFGVCCSLRVVCCLMLVRRRFWFVDCCMLFVVRFFWLVGVCCLFSLFDGRCWCVLSLVGLLLFNG